MINIGFAFMNRKKMSDNHLNVRDAIGYQLKRSSQTLTKQLQRNFIAEGFEITPQQWGILIALWNGDGVNQQEIADVTFADKVSVHKFIDGLEKKEFVKRESDPADRRANLIFLTAKGKEIVPALMRIARQTIRDATRNISDEHAEICKDVLEKIYYNIKN